jgi:hypothetical protein
MAATIGNARSHLRGRWAISEGISDPNKTEIAIRQSIRQEIREKLGSRLGNFRPHSTQLFTFKFIWITQILKSWYVPGIYQVYTFPIDIPSIYPEHKFQIKSCISQFE